MIKEINVKVKIYESIMIFSLYLRLNGSTSEAALLESSDHIPYAVPTSSLTSVNLLNVTAPKEDVLFTYLNTPDPSPKRTAESYKSLSTTSSLLVEHPTDDTDSDLSIQSDHISPTPSHVSIEMLPNALDDKDAEINMENANLCSYTEVQTLDCANLDKSTEVIQNGILIFTLSINFFSVSFSIYILHFHIVEHNNVEEHSNIFYPQPRYKIKSNNIKTNNLDSPVDSANKRKYTREMERNLEKQNEFLGKQTDYQKEIVVLNGKLKALEVEKLEQSKQIIDLQSIIDRNRQELNSIRSELEQHKARALKTLQEKEKLITELKSNAPTAMDEAIIMELNQLK